MKVLNKTNFETKSGEQSTRLHHTNFITFRSDKETDEVVVFSSSIVEEKDQLI